MPGAGAPSGVDAGPKRAIRSNARWRRWGVCCGASRWMSSPGKRMSPWLTEWRERARAGAASALKERERDDREDEIARLKSKVGEITMDNELLSATIAAMVRRNHGLAAANLRMRACSTVVSGPASWRGHDQISAWAKPERQTAHIDCAHESRLLEKSAACGRICEHNRIQPIPVRTPLDSFASKQIPKRADPVDSPCCIATVFED